MSYQYTKHGNPTVDLTVHGKGFSEAVKISSLSPDDLFVKATSSDAIWRYVRKARVRMNLWEHVAERVFADGHMYGDGRLHTMDPRTRVHKVALKVTATVLEVK